MIFYLTVDPLYNKLLCNDGSFWPIGFGGGSNMSDKLPLIDCRSLDFSPQLSERRMDQAQQSFGPGVIQRILCFALFLFGLNRSAIGRALGIPANTTKSIIKAINRDGLRALEDRRMKSSLFQLKQASSEPPPITLRGDDKQLVVDFGLRDRAIHLCRQDSLQMKTVLLSMFNSGLLSTRQVSEALGLTPSYVAALARRLREQGALSLVDQRQGQKEDYLVTPGVKAEIIQQFAVDVITSGRSSSTAIAEKLEERCDIVVSDRTVRHHLSRMGLRNIKHSLPQLAKAVKKTSNNCSKL